MRTDVIGQAAPGGSGTGWSPGGTMGHVRVTLRYFDDCPSWRTADERLREALSRTGNSGVEVRYERVETADDAERLAFVGSPTILVDGIDPFAAAGAPVGLACRVYPTPDGLRGSPTLDQLVAVLARPSAATSD